MLVVVLKVLFLIYVGMSEIFMMLMSNLGVEFGIHPLFRFVLGVLIFGLPLYLFNFFIACIISFVIFTIIHFIGNNSPVGELESQSNKVYIITGVSEDGIGYFLAKKALKLGAIVILACRNVQKTKELIPDLIKDSGNKNVHILELDCSSMESIRNFVKNFKSKFDKLDVLINNAGVNVMNRTSEDGFELITAVNYLSVYSLSLLLLDELKKTNGRIVITSSEAQAYPQDEKVIEDDWTEKMMDTYGRSKLYVNMFTKELQNRLNSEKSGVSVYAFHPGVVFSAIWGKFFPKLVQILYFRYFWLRMRTPEVGANTGIYLAANKDVVERKGEYFMRNNVYPINEIGTNPKLRKRLWERTQKIHDQFFNP
eukprot:gene2214-2388_t